MYHTSALISLILINLLVSVIDCAETSLDRLETCVIPNDGCAPDDEFAHSLLDYTVEWMDFMNLLTKKTFDNNTHSCGNGNEVVINKDSQIIWDIRFKIYDERHDKNEKTINDCYCDSIQFPKCDVSFEDCMKKARISMKKYIETIWDAEITKYVENQCLVT